MLLWDGAIKYPENLGICFYSRFRRNDPGCTFQNPVTSSFKILDLSLYAVRKTLHMDFRQIHSDNGIHRFQAYRVYQKKNVTFKYTAVLSI